MPHLGLRVRVERRERLVEEQHARVARERTGERDALPLAAGELGRLRGGEVPDPEPLEQRVHVAAAGAEGDVRPHAQVGEEGVVLEDEPDAAPVGRKREPERGVEPCFAVECHASPLRLCEACDDAQRRASCPRRKARRARRCARPRARGLARRREEEA